MDMFLLAVLCLISGAWSDVTQSNPTTSTTTPSSCRLNLKDAGKIHDKIVQHQSDGTVLIEYSLTFEDPASMKGIYTVGEGNTSVVIPDVSYSYKVHEWKRVFSRHGYALLSLPFNYKMLSTYLLSFGVINMDIEVSDDPPSCFDALSGQEQLNLARNFILFNLHYDSVETSFVDENNYACHTKVISDEGDNAVFTYECCTKTKNMLDVQCSDYESNRWVNLLFTAIEWMDSLFFLFAPLFALGLIYGRSYKTTNYIVQLGEPSEMMIKKDCQDVELSPLPVSTSGTTSMEDRKPFLENNNLEEVSMKKKFVQNLKKIPVNSVAKMSLPVQHVLVDHKKLMSVKDVNVGLVSFLWNNIFMCRIRKSFPFNHCCKVSICGSWGKRFFCCIIPRFPCIMTMQRLNRRTRKHLSWENVLQSVALFVVFLMIPLPFYIRSVIYLVYEKEELVERQSILKSMNISFGMADNLFFYFVPHHPVFLTALVVYAVASLVLLIFSRKNKMLFIDYMVGILRDFKHLDRLQVFRMMALHLIMPFEKFGLLGIIIGPFVWLVTFPLGILIILFYCVPTVYLAGKLIFLHKPRWINYIFCHGEEKFDHPERVKALGIAKPKYIDGNDDEIRTINKMMLLQNISPPTDDVETPTPLKDGGVLSSRAMFHFSSCTKRIIGFILTLWMVSVLILYAEFFGFLIEVVTLTFMGAIVNAGSAGQFFILVFFTLTYALTVFNKVDAKYRQLASELFSHIQNKLKHHIDDTVIIRGTEQKNFAFKFFSKQELRDLNSKRQLSIISDVSGELPNVYNDKFKLKAHKLHIRMHSVVLFLDKFDCPRIPKKLFQRVCQIRCPGCPGPLHENLFLAFKEISYLVIFIFFVLIVVLAFGDAYEISTTNQLLLTVVGGFAPFVIRVILKPKDIHIDFSTYAFKGKVHEVITDYVQSWPVFDMEFDVGDKAWGKPVKDILTVTDDTEVGNSSEGEGNKPVESPEPNGNGNTVAEISENPVKPIESQPLGKTAETTFSMAVTRDHSTVAIDNPRMVDPGNLYQLETNVKTENDESEIDLILHMRHSGKEGGSVNNCVVS